MNYLRNQGGFTLIELVIVIIILGVLSATVAPKFLNLRDDAEGTSISSFVGAVKSARIIAFSQYILAGNTYASPSDLPLAFFVQCDDSNVLTERNFIALAGVRSSIFSDPTRATDNTEEACINDAGDDYIEFDAKSGRRIIISTDSDGIISMSANPVY